MKLAIISDSHDNIPRIDQMLGILKSEKINIIIHCGDVATLQTLKYLSENFNGTVYLSIGNVDQMHGLEKKYIHFKNVIVFKKFGELTIENINIAFVHFPKIANSLAKTQKYDFVFYGHTHKPWEEKITGDTSTSSVSLINPGTLAGMFTKSTFAVLDTENKNVELIVL